MPRITPKQTGLAEKTERQGPADSSSVSISMPMNTQLVFDSDHIVERDPTGVFVYSADPSRPHQNACAAPTNGSALQSSTHPFPPLVGDTNDSVEFAASEKHKTKAEEKEHDGLAASSASPKFPPMVIGGSKQAGQPNGLGIVQFAATLEGDIIKVDSTRGWFTPASEAGALQVVWPSRHEAASLSPAEAAARRAVISAHFGVAFAASSSAQRTPTNQTLTAPPVKFTSRNSSHHIDGPVAALYRYSSDLRTRMDEGWNPPNDSWKDRFYPMLGSVGQHEDVIILNRLTADIFRTMTDGDLEAVLSHPSGDVMRGVRWEGKQDGMISIARSISSAAFMALGVRALGDEDKFVDMIGIRPQIGIEIAALRNRSIIDAPLLIGVLRKAAARSMVPGTVSYVKHACAGATLSYNWLTQQHGSAAHAHRHTSMEHLLTYMQNAAQEIINRERSEGDIANEDTLNACGRAWAMFVGGIFLYAIEQQRHGATRNKHIAFSLKSLMSVGLTLLGGFTAGAGPAVAWGVRAGTTAANIAAPDLIDKGTNRFFPIYDWAPAMNECSRELRSKLTAAMANDAGTDTAEILKPAVSAFFDGFDSATGNIAAGNPKALSL